MEQYQAEPTLEKVKQLEAGRDLEGLLALLAPAFSVMIRRAAARSLYTVADPKIVPQLVANLATEPDRGVRQTLIETLGRLGDDAGVDGLVQALKDPEPMVRQAAARALARYNSQAAFDALLTAVQNREDWSVRQAAAESLGQLGDRRAIPVLLETLRDSHNLVRPAAAQALGQLGDPAVIPALKRARHTTPHARGSDCAECKAIDQALKSLEA